jgi:HK97 family phage major capsid protein
MNKKMREILAKIQAKTAEAKGFMDGENKDVEKANALMDEVDSLNKEYETEKRLFEAEKAIGAEKGAPVVAEPEKKVEESPLAKFAKAVRSILRGEKGLVEGGDGANGGYTVPEDVQTKVNKWAEADYSLLNDIDVVPVSTNKGARTYQKKGKADVFVDLDENGAITKEITAPQFERVSYAIQDRAGFMPVSNDLINDSDANIMTIVSEWLGKANVATSNAKILEIINGKADTDFVNIDGIKKAINVTLGQAYKNSSKIITNDDGLNYLDTLKDKNDRPLLNPDPTDSAKLTLRCGTVVVPVKVLPNDVLASEGTKIPFIIGDLKAGIRKWDRQSMSIKASDVAVIGDFNAYAMNMTLVRAIMRDDYTEMDKDSYVRGHIDSSVTGE